MNGMGPMTKKRILLLSIIPAILLVIVIVWIVAASGSDETEENDPDAVLTQAMQTALARMTQTPVASPTATFILTVVPSMTSSPTGLPSPTNTTAPIIPLPTSSSCDTAGFVADITIPDGTQLSPGQAFRKTWELRNNGTCTWNSSYQVVYYSGAQMGATSPQQLTTGTVSPGQTIQISIDMVSPSQEGRHIGNWVLRNDKGTIFGIGGSGPFYVDITVVAGGVIGSPTPTATGGGSISTATATRAPASNTPVPTNTEAPKPTDTQVSGTAYP